MCVRAHARGRMCTPVCIHVLTRARARACARACACACLRLSTQELAQNANMQAIKIVKRTITFGFSLIKKVKEYTYLYSKC